LKNRFNGFQKCKVKARYKIARVNGALVGGKVFLKGKAKENPDLVELRYVRPRFKEISKRKRGKSEIRSRKFDQRPYF